MAWSIIFDFMYYLIMSGFDLYSVFYIMLLIGIWRLIRFSRQSIPKYISSITGEVVSFRPNVYDVILSRVFPENNFDIISKLRLEKKEYSYALFFNNFQFLYDSLNGIIENSKIIARSNHVILIFNKTESNINFICENNLQYALMNPMTILDSWSGNFVLGDFYPEIDSSHNWLNKRLNILQNITDESFVKLDGRIAKTASNESEKTNAENTLLRLNIVNSSSFESLRQNMHLMENNLSKNDHSALKTIYGNGIFELNTLFRQLHESPSIPSRFIDLLNISECISRYFCGFCFAIRSNDELSIHNDLKFDTRAISFGTCVDFLARWKKKDFANSLSILETRIIKFLDINYLDSENTDNLISFLKNMNPNSKVKYSRKPTVTDLLWWLVSVRNKTRGHGTPSKVDYQFYICLEKVTLFLLSEISKLNFYPSLRTKLDDQEWTIDLSKGGLPVFIPIVDKLEKNIHLNPLLSDKDFENYSSRHFDILSNIPENDENLYLKVIENDKTEWWKCRDYFKIKNGVVYILNQRNDSSESWISFSTGKVMRPEISEF